LIIIIFIISFIVAVCMTWQQYGKALQRQTSTVLQVCLVAWCAVLPR
jgi:hypothetical protein